MGSTTFSGPVTSRNGFVGNVTGTVIGTASAVSGPVTASVLVAPLSTSALLGAKAGAVNTANKVSGATVYNTTTKTFYVAQGATDVSTWIDAADGTTTITPA